MDVFRKPGQGKQRDSGMVYMEADKALASYDEWMKSSRECLVAYRPSHKQMMKRRRDFGPDAVALVVQDTLEFIK